MDNKTQQEGQRVAICYATKSGEPTFDDGGNPFATALIELSSLSQFPISEFASRLHNRTMELSGGDQSPEWVGAEPTIDWRLPKPQIGTQCRRVALVLVVSDYEGDKNDLGGAAWDELRVSAMLARNGFSVTQGVGSSRADLLRVLQTFAEVSRDSDFAIIYSTGHGYEADNVVYLLPGDYPIKNGFSPAELAQSGVSVSLLAEVCSAHTLNLVFFAGCRTV